MMLVPLVIAGVVGYLAVGVAVVRFAIARMDRPPSDPVCAGWYVLGWPLIVAFGVGGLLLDVLGRAAGADRVGTGWPIFSDAEGNPLHVQQVDRPRQGWQ
jgi:hypothetical protein